MRIAAIDIGTNSVHMIVVQVRPDQSFEVVDREKVMVRLGAGGLDGRKMTSAAMTAGVQALTRFRRLAEARGVDEIIAAATSATREAANGGEFLAAIASETGIRARVITGPEEARLIHLAASYNTTFTGPTVVFDIGGGSVEITYGRGPEPELARSFKIGVIRLTERFLRSDPVSSRDERRLVRHVREQVTAYVELIRHRGFVRVIGTSGTITSLGALALMQGGTPVHDVANLDVPRRAIRKLRKQVLGLDQQGRMQVDGLDPKRADLAPAGVLLIDTVLSDLGAETITLSDFALREGLVLDYIRKHAGHIAAFGRFPDVRRRSVMELGERFQYWTPHAAHVAALALRLFDQTRAVHGLDVQAREWLEYGALLHDIGMHISHKAHHRHSYYLIQHGGLRGLSPTEVEVVAQVALSHRRGRPKKSQPGYADLPKDVKRAVRVLAACVAVAESLDRSQAQVVRDVTIEDRGDVAVAGLALAGDAELEMWAAQRHLPALSRVLGKPLHLEARDSAGAPQRRGATGKPRHT